MAQKIPSQTFNLRNVSTRSVTLYPSRAHVLREIADIQLEPGANEIEILGLGPMVDEQSIQIEGRGQATITDISVNLVPNDERYEDVYPESDDDDEEDDDDELDDDESDALKAFDNEIQNIKINLEAAQEREQSAQNQSMALSSFNNTLPNQDSVKPADISELMVVYEQNRDRLFKNTLTARADVERLTKELEKKQKQKQKIFKAELKQQADAKKAKEKEKVKKDRKKQEKQREASRIKLERIKYWASSVYRIVLRLETTVNETPGTSRRNSIDSVTLAKATPEKIEKITPKDASKLEVSLLISYVTDNAFWTPRYDVSISSVQKSATITYRAELTNNTSETWKDSKVILSTAQVQFSGLEDKAPTMHPWPVRLTKYYKGMDDKEVIRSAEEMANSVAKSHRQNQVNKKKMLGNIGSGAQSMRPPPPPARALSNAFRNRSSTYAAPKLFGSSQPGGAPQMSQIPQMQQMQQQYDPTIEDSYRDGAAWGGRGPVNDEAGSESEEDNNVDFEESSWEDYGLTATYELPGTRTLDPSSINRRYKIATIQSPNITLSHIAIPKLRAAAFLRAKVRNPSSTITLIKGSAGITLDGSFLGSMPLSRVSPGQMFTIPLGVDPAIDIRYPKPSVHRSSQGIFSKETAQVFTRSIIVTNTKPIPVELLVLDQVPMSQDERLKIDIVQPKGLNKENDQVKTGIAMNEGPKSASWGKATATLKKNGEVCWTVNMEKGQASCVLKLEYCASLPATDSIVNA